MSSVKSTAISAIARTGYIAKGLVYFMVGLLTLQTTLGMGGETSDATNAFKELISQPFGTIMLFGIMLGLIAHAIWRILEGLIDPEDRGDGAQVVFFRIIDFLVGCLYLSVSYAAWQILQGLDTQSGDESTKVWVGKILELPYGMWLVLFCALVILIGGLYQFYAAYNANFDDAFDYEEMNRKEQKTLRWLGRIGTGAWGVVYCMVAYLFYNAAVTFDADEAGGLDQALKTLGDQPYGTLVLGITACGLIIYGIYLFVLSFYHKIFNT